MIKSVLRLVESEVIVTALLRGEMNGSLIAKSCWNGAKAVFIDSLSVC